MVLGLAALVVGGGLSLLASALPDGLEWAIAGVNQGAELAPSAASALTEGWQAAAPLPDYALPQGGGGSLAGLIGAILTFALAALSGWLIARRRKARAKHG